MYIGVHLRFENYVLGAVVLEIVPVDLVLELRKMRNSLCLTQEKLSHTKIEDLSVKLAR